MPAIVASLCGFASKVFTQVSDFWEISVVFNELITELTSLLFFSASLVPTTIMSRTLVAEFHYKLHKMGKSNMIPPL